MGPHGKLLILVKKTDFFDIERRISEKSCSGWKQQVEIRSIEEKKDVRKNNADSARYVSVTDTIVDEWHESSFSKIILQNHLAVDKKRLDDLRIPMDFARSKDVLLKFIFEELKKRKLFWLSHADSQWKKSGIRHLNPEAWAKQFHDLGFPWIGVNLLKLLKVVSDDELRNAFKIPESENVGLNVVHTYFRDDEPGSSSLNIKDILEHLYPAHKIIEYDPDCLDNIDKAMPDIMYIYEDGLWSGVELVRRLNRIHNNDAIKKPLPQIQFRYGVTSDAGLIAGRLFNKRKGISNIQLRPANPEYHFGFLRGDAAAVLESLFSASDDEIRKAIDSAVDPFAFQSEEFWEGKKLEAITICANLGSQLVRPFLERRRKNKATSTGDDDASAQAEIPEEKLTRWALGALRFASTVSFASSVPKPVLPLMWLAGPVCIDDRKLEWRPLFWDVRRTDAIDYSRSPDL